MTDSENQKLLAALKANWQAEMQGHHTYLAFAEKEADPQRRNALRGLVAAEKLHADLWAGGIEPSPNGVYFGGYVRSANATPAAHRRSHLF